MPYKKISELPVEVKKLPIKAQKMFLAAFNNSIKRVDEDVAFKVAWAAVKTKFKKVNNTWVAKGMGIKLYKFDLELNDKVFIKKADNGEHYLEAVLSETTYDKDGKRFTPKALQDFAKQINKYGLNGFITHADWDEFCMNNSHLDAKTFIAKARKERRGILKTIKAVYEKGKLWIKAFIDKRYLNKVKKFNKVSIETHIPMSNQVGNDYTGGSVLGFALDNNAIHPNAVATVV